MSYKNITPDDVLSFTRPTDTFLCQLAANTHGIEFLDFTISDYESKSVIFNVGRDNPPPMDMDIDLANIDENTFRSIKYEFSEDVLRLPAIQTSLVFAVGDREVPNFRMIERHYFRNSLVKSYDFKFGFCIPNSTNTWDAVYAVPPLDEDLIADMLAEPYETRSDSFYFVSGRLIMHNKASYKYIREDGDPQSKSYQSRYKSKTGLRGQERKAASKYSDSDEEPEGPPAAAARKQKTKPEGKASSKYDDDENGVWSKEEDYY